MFDKSLIKSGQTVAVALSGGKDSICLLHMLLNSRDELNINIKAVHVDHSIRGEESERDKNFAIDYCKSLGVEITVETVDAVKFSKENGYSVEQGARILRYGVFSKLVSSGYAELIATAHHKNDSFETLLFNLFRGAGIKGLTGIPSKNDYIIRPLINLTREEIDLYADKHQLPFVFDSTNLEAKYSRNYIRNEIVPKILQKFPDAVNAGARFSKIAKEEDLYLDNLAKLLITERDEKFYIPLSAEDVLLSRAIIIALSKVGLEKDYEYVHVLQIKNLKNLQSGAEVTLPKNVLAKREYENVVIFINEQKINDIIYDYSVNSFNFNGKTIEISNLDGELKFDGDKIPKGAIIRTRNEGDVFTKFGGGTKKLKEFLIDKKIPALERDNIPLIALGNVVYLIFGVEISDHIKITKETKNVLYAKIKNSR